MEDSFDISILDDDSFTEAVKEVEVMSPSGTQTSVLTEREASFYNTMSRRYQEDNSFKNISDLSELDRILIMELMSFRWSQWILLETDYDGRKVDPANLQNYIEKYSKEIRGIKKDLGMDKSSRNKDKESSIADYIQNLQRRAKEFGVTRNEQAVKAITILKELEGLVTLHFNSTESERKEFKCTAADIMEHIQVRAREFDEIDEALRAEQKYWIREI